MYVEQVSVLLENKTGRLADVTRVLADNHIDIKGVCVADTVDFGILRLIVSDPEAAQEALSSNGFTASVTQVIAVRLDDVPGGLHEVLDTLRQAGIGLDYIYSINKIGGGHAGLIFKVSDPEAATKVLTQNGIKLYEQDDLRVTE